MSNLIEGLKDCSDAILGIRESIGADLRKCSIVTRTWSGNEVGEGTMEEVVSPVEPTPGIRDLSHDTRVKEGGAIQQGDLFITMISKHRFPTKADVDCSTGGKSIEKFYQLGSELYQVISVAEKQLTWDVQVRRLSDQRRKSRAI